MNTTANGQNLTSETLARLYEEQGEIDRARSIRATLMKTGGWQMTLEATTAPFESERQILLERVQDNALQCRFSVDRRAIQAVTSSFPASLKEYSTALTPVLRLVSVRPAAPGPVREFEDLEITDLEGTCRIEGLGSGPGWLCASVGLRHESGRFHSVAHSEVIDL